MSMDYAARIWFKPDRKWFKLVKKQCVDRQGKKKDTFSLNVSVYLCCVKWLIQPMDHYAILTNKLTLSVVER